LGTALAAAFGAVYDGLGLVHRRTVQHLHEVAFAVFRFLLAQSELLDVGQRSLHQFGQEALSAGVVEDEGVGQQGLCLGAQTGADVEAVPHEGVELAAPPAGFLEGLHGFVFELPHGDEGFKVAVGDHSFGQFDGGDAQGPDIGFVGVLCVFHDFGAHPVGRAHLGLMPGVGVHAFGRDSEVCEFGNSFLVKKDVGGFDVAVDLLVPVQVDQSLEN
jgi:hypothetical protein